MNWQEYKLEMKRIWREALLRLRVGKKAAAYTLGLIEGDLVATGRLSAKVFRGDGTVEDLGLISTQLVDTSGVNYLASLLASGSANTMYYHATGTGTTAAAITDTALVTEVGTRATGTHTSSTNVYTTIGTCTPGGTYAITEWGCFSASTAGTLLDRAVFAAINVTSADSIQFTFNLTLPAGG
ncbi:MAG: hypothetical protein KGL39_50705 [Patescibacteria group bacterium]|nr:hypothetical protein [Patescibacteria group bacterium]